MYNSVRRSVFASIIQDGPDTERSESVENYTPRFDRRSAAERLAQAEKFEQMAEQFKSNSKLSESFRSLADEAREQVRRLFG